jgi:4-hydroxythreonine-4-phosphate dehydrogenase
MPLPLIAITMGDPAGVGPEVCLLLLANVEVREFAAPLIFGDLAILRRCAEKTGLPLPEPSLVRDLTLFDDTDFEPGVVSARTGAAGYGYVIASIEAALAGEIAGVATAPLNKEALRAAGVLYPGHTEIFADKTGAKRSCMFQYSDEVRASFVTVHCGYDEVPALLTVERILDVIELTADAMQRIRGTRPHLAVLGLNPHAGEGGHLGHEEIVVIEPVLQRLRAEGLNLVGPLPADTLFQSKRLADADAVLAMYHDQGLPVLKHASFGQGVNITLGLPIIRTSVDHGTALDLAGTGRIDAGSLQVAIDAAWAMARQRRAA